MELKPDSLIIKNNMLNEMRGRMTLTEYRLFCVYLARIDTRSEDTIRVRYPLNEYGSIMEIKRIRQDELKSQAENIVCKPITIANKNGAGFTTMPLFIEFSLLQDNNEWFIELEANKKLAPYLFEQKERFFKYKLYNTIRLGSYNQIRIYELLKQYEWLDNRTISLVDLREFLGIGENEYTMWGDFSQKILKVAQKAILENTDICFEYKPIIKNRKTVAVEFMIHKNERFIDQLNLSDYILSPCEDENLKQNDEFTVVGNLYNTENMIRQDIDDEEPEGEKRKEETYLLCSSALPENLTRDEVEHLINLARPIVATNKKKEESMNIALYHYLSGKNTLLKAQKKKVTNEFSWLSKAVGGDWK